MLNESKVKLMTRMAMYESKQGEEDFKISSYYKKDYRSFHTIATIIWVTVGYAVAVGIGVIAFLDELMGNLNMDAYNDMSERIVGARSAERSVSGLESNKTNRGYAEGQACLHRCIDI